MSSNEIGRSYDGKQATALSPSVDTFVDNIVTHRQAADDRYIKRLQDNNARAINMVFQADTELAHAHNELDNAASVKHAIIATARTHKANYRRAMRGWEVANKQVEKLEEYLLVLVSVMLTASFALIMHNFGW